MECPEPAASWLCGSGIGLALFRTCYSVRESGLVHRPNREDHGRFRVRDCVRLEPAIVSPAAFVGDQVQSFVAHIPAGANKRPTEALVMGEKHQSGDRTGREIRRSAASSKASAILHPCGAIVFFSCLPWLDLTLHIYYISASLALDPENITTVRRGMK